MTASILSFTIRCPRSQNTSKRQHWATRHRARRAMYVEVMVAMQKDPRWRAAVIHPTLASDRRKRRVVFTRGIGIAKNASGRGSHPTYVADKIRYAASLEHVLDVLCMDRPRRRGLGVLVDDAPQWLDDVYEQNESVEPGMLRVDVHECEVTP